jgi:hypothetical protein
MLLFITLIECKNRREYRGKKKGLNIFSPIERRGLIVDLRYVGY